MVEHYPGQFEPADLSQAYDLLDYCLKLNIVIDLDQLDNPYLAADLIIVKCKELSKYEAK